MTEDAGQIFKGLINEYKAKANRSQQELEGFPKPRSHGKFWFNSETGVFYIALLDEQGETMWREISDVMGSRPLSPD